MKLIAFLNSYVQGISGGYIWFINVAKRLGKKDIDVVVVTSKLGKRACKEHGLTDVDYKITTTEDEPGNVLLLYLKRIFSFLKLDLNTDNEDIIFASSTFLPDIIPLIFLKGRKTTIFHMKAPNPIYGYRGAFRKDKKLSLSLNSFLYFLNEKLALPLFKLVGNDIFVLPTTKKVVENYGFSEDRIKITKNGVDLEYIENVPSEEKKYDACWLGRVHPQKGIDDLIEVWKEVVREYPNAKLLMMGGGTERYSRRVLEKGLDNNIEIKGYVCNEKYRFMKQSKLFILPSYYESFPITILEAAACELPILAYDLPVYEKIYGDELICVPIGDKKALAGKAIKLLKDKATRERVSKKIKDLAYDYSWDDIAKEFWRELR